MFFKTVASNIRFSILLQLSKAKERSKELWLEAEAVCLGYIESEADDVHRGGPNRNDMTSRLRNERPKFRADGGGHLLHSCLPRKKLMK